MTAWIKSTHVVIIEVNIGEPQNERELDHRVTTALETGDYIINDIQTTREFFGDSEPTNTSGI